MFHILLRLDTGGSRITNSRGRHGFFYTVHSLYPRSITRDVSMTTYESLIRRVSFRISWAAIKKEAAGHNPTTYISASITQYLRLYTHYKISIAANRPATSISQFTPALQRPQQRNLINILQITTHRHATCDPADPDPCRLDQPADVHSRSLSLQR